MNQPHRHLPWVDSDIVLLGAIRVGLVWPADHKSVSYGLESDRVNFPGSICAIN
jgi:hypothetical protein